MENDVLQYLWSEVFGIQEPVTEKVSSHDVAIVNFLSVVPELQKFLFFGFLVAVDTFLYLFTYFPIRLCIGLFSLVSELQSYLIGSSSAYYLKANDLGLSINKIRLFDLLRGLMFLISFVVLYRINLSTIYHLIRYQNTIKLCVLAAMIEVVDKLLSTFGQDVFDSLHYNLQKSRFPALQILVSILYVVVHSVLYFFQVATLTVVVNSTDDALLTHEVVLLLIY
jgi:hypothetical protein